MSKLELTIESIGGSCPVQGYGTFGQYPFYFRARGDRWELHVALDPSHDPVDVGFGEVAGYSWEEPYGDQCGFDAGYMPLDKARTFIEQCFKDFQSKMNE